jgi:hypothetical protein
MGASGLATASSTYQPLVSGVSNTEIGYLDGVTSAIQTQLNAKAPLASPSFTGNVGIGGTATANAKLDVFGTNSRIRWENTTTTASEISTNLAANAYVDKSSDAASHSFKVSGTEKILLNSSGNVGIGKTPSYALDVNGTVNATALFVGGSALSSSSITLLSTTNLSGASTTISSINQGYTDLLILIRGLVNTSASKTNMQINGVTSGNYSYGWVRTINGSTVSNTNMNSTYFEGVIENTDGGSAGAQGYSIINIPQYTTTNYMCTYQGVGATAGNTWQSFITGGGLFRGTAVTSLTFLSQSASFSSGQVLIYGVK